MSKIELTTAIAKMYLAIQFAEGQLYLIKDHLKQRPKFLCNSAIRSVQSLCREVEKVFNEQNIEFAEEDVELLDKIMNLLIQAEKDGTKSEILGRLK